MNRSRRSWRRPMHLLVGCWLLVGVGCGPSADDLTGWLRQPQGPGKLAALVADPQRDTALRLTAARLLLEHDGEKELAGALSRLPGAERTRLVDALQPDLLNLLNGPVDRQLHAKEAIYLFGGYASEPLRQELWKKVLDWAFADFPARYRQGDHNLAQILPAMGSETTLPLLRQLQLGRGIQEATETLVTFKLPEVDRAAAILLAEAVRQALADPIRREPSQISIPLANSVLRLARPELTSALLAAAGDPRVKVDIRQDLLEHVGECKGPDAEAGLVKLLRSDDFRAPARILLQLRGLAGLAQVLQELPEDAPYPRDEEAFYQLVDFFCDEDLGWLRTDRGVSRDQLEQVLLGALPRLAWPGRAVAIHCLGLHGSNLAWPELEQASLSTIRLPGWKPAGATLGQLAQASLGKLKRR